MKLSRNVMQIVLGLSSAVSRPFGYRGYYRVAEALAKVSTAEPLRIKLGLSSEFEFDSSDPYWLSLLGRAYDYEPEVAHCLHVISAASEFEFIDCGANYGYWSVLATDSSLRCVGASAVEADMNTFKKLERNRALNEDRFSILHKAVGSADGLMVTIGGEGNHAGRRVAKEGETLSGTLGEVESVTLRTLLERTKGGGLTVIKLDVEGAEVDSLSTLPGLPKPGLVVIFEDHGRDIHSQNVSFAIEALGMEVFFLTRSGGIPVASADEASKLKKRLTVGYNFLATSNPEIAALIRL